MGDKLEFEVEATWDIITDEINEKFMEYAEKELGRKLTEYDIENYTVTVKIEASLF